MTGPLTKFPGVTTFNTEPLHAFLGLGLAGFPWDSTAPVPLFIAAPTHIALEASVLMADFPLLDRVQPEPGLLMGTSTLLL